MLKQRKWVVVLLIVLAGLMIALVFTRLITPASMTACERLAYIADPANATEMATLGVHHRPSEADKVINAWCKQVKNGG